MTNNDIEFSVSKFDAFVLAGIVLATVVIPFLF